MRSFLQFLPVLSRRPRARRLGGRWPTPARVRKLVAVSLFVVAGVLALQPPSASGEPTAPMLVTARPVASGSVLQTADLHVVQAPRSVLPDGVLTRRASATGRVLAGAARRGEPLTAARLLDRGGRIAGGPGTATVPVRLSDSGVADLLQPGAVVDVVTFDGHSGAGRVLAEKATVVTVTRPRTADPPRGRLVLIALPATTANRVAAVSLNQPVAITLR